MAYLADADPGSSLGRQVTPAKRTRWNLVALALAAALGFTAFALTRSPQPDPTAAEWQRRATMFNHCNQLQVDVYLERNTDAHYRALCFAVAGRIEQARATLEGMPTAQRARAVDELFAIADGITRRGDVRSAGPIMTVVAAYDPQNRAARYHASMAEQAAPYRGSVSAAEESPNAAPRAARVASRPSR